MEQPKRGLEIDPDYKSNETALKRAKIKEDKEKQNAIEKFKEIVNREFSLELEHREKQLEVIQQNLTKAQKTLHLLRYVVITSYYNKPELQINTNDETNEMIKTIDKQNRIHPAVKKLLSNNFTNVDLNYSSTRRKRVKQIKYLNNTVTQESDENILKSQLKKEVKKECVIEEDKLTNDNVEDSKYNFVRNRKKVKHRILIGNISKWMPSESKEDNSTHKWMIYVRGPKDEPDISHFVQKVVFYLHPSYKPNDVVELKEYPFHLSRRGWGEFPLRVQIHFRCSLNKPVDVVHDLKLDRTYSGRQTLGNETVVDLSLYENEKCEKLPTIENMEKKLQLHIAEDLKQSQVEQNNCSIKEEVMDDSQEAILDNASSSYFEHDYCFADVKQEDILNVAGPSNLNTDFTNIYDDHSYCVNKINNFAENSNENTYEHHESDLMIGLDEENNSNNIIEEVVFDNNHIEQKKPFVRNISEQHFQKYVTSDGRVIMIKKRKKAQQSLLKKIFQKQFNKTEFQKQKMVENYSSRDKYKIVLPQCRFKNVQEALPYLLQRLPIVTELSQDLNYKFNYPYAVNSLESYSKWNIIKRRSSEWRRAKIVLKLLEDGNIYGYEKWNTKLILLYARSHCYTPLVDYKLFGKHSFNELLLNYQINPQPLTVNTIYEPDIQIDVDDCNEENETKNTDVKDKIIVSDPTVKTICSFIRHETLDNGILLKHEEIIPGVQFNAAERMLLQAITSLTNNLIRKAVAFKVLQGNYSNEAVVNEDDVRQALTYRPEFKYFTSKR